MYHTIVKRIGRTNFELVNKRDFEAVLKGCAPNIKHRFGGDHALGGERNDKESLRRWFGRLQICCGDLKLHVVDVWAKGWPHDTYIFVRWTATATYPDGTPYINHGVHIVQLKWGKAVFIDANEDSQAVDRYLKAKAAAGCAEAEMPMIQS